ncbi:MAG: CRISPR-associated protein Csm7 [Magnetococcales bacterium]|nr:CRISPR-associated protein Csm7 [Magnetococcales bacterium]
MKTLLVTLRPLTAFATPPHGDTLFGQLCWTLLNRHGEAWLTERLTGYLQGKPFLVVSDLVPSGHWPRPFLPPGFLSSETLTKEGNRKIEKKKIWFSWKAQEGWKQKLSSWGGLCRLEEDVWKENRKERPQPHNSINRLTGTTGTDGFAPYAVSQTWFPEEALLDLWLVYDPERISRETLEVALQDVGQWGFGKDASAGLGKFSLEQCEASPLPRQKDANAWMTLGFCAPQGLGFDPDRSFYQPFTRFGRHGDRAAVTGQPFKNPILMTRAGAVLTPRGNMTLTDVFVGQGLGGEGRLSKAIPETVHQGYAPVVGIRLPLEKGR